VYLNAKAAKVGAKNAIASCDLQEGDGIAMQGTMLFKKCLEGFS